jgi:hypothetical protein
VQSGRSEGTLVAITTDVATVTAALLVAAALTGVSASAGANDRVFTLRCELTSTSPRNGGTTQDKPFTQHFHIKRDAGTVDGRKAVVASDRIGWEPRQPWFRPYATLSRPQWQYHSARQIGRVPYSIDGPCVVEQRAW